MSPAIVEQKTRACLVVPLSILHTLHAVVFRGQSLGKYRILEPLGSGGFGTVYLAEDTWIDKRVALKVPHRQNVDFGELLREPRLLASLNHPNIVTVITAETADEGLDAIRKHRPDAAVIDLRLRRGTGREVVVSIPPEIPVIIFSGLRSESADLEHIRPLTRLIEKPYSLVMLVDTLQDMLEEARAARPG